MKSHHNTQLTHTQHTAYTYTIHSLHIHNTQLTHAQYTAYTYIIHNIHLTHTPYTACTYTIHSLHIYNTQLTHTQFTAYTCTIHRYYMTELWAANANPEPKTFGPYFYIISQAQKKAVRRQVPECSDVHGRVGLQ